MFFPWFDCYYEVQPRAAGCKNNPFDVSVSLGRRPAKKGEQNETYESDAAPRAYMMQQWETSRRVGGPRSGEEPSARKLGPGGLVQTLRDKEVNKQKKHILWNSKNPEIIENVEFPEAWPV